MRMLTGFAIVALTATGSGWCLDSTPTPTTPAPATVKHGTPAGPGRELVSDTDGQGRTYQELRSTDTPLSADMLPKLDLARIHGLAAVQAEFPKATEASVVKTYESLNAKDSPGYDEGLIAVQLYALHAAVAKERGECWYQTAAFHADLAQQSGCKDVLVKAISAGFRIEIHLTFKGDEHQRFVNEVLALQGSAYPPVVKIAAALCVLPELLKFADNQADPGLKPDDPRNDIPRLLDAGVADIEEMAKRGVPLRTLYQYAHGLLNQTSINGHWPGELWTALSPQSFKGGQRADYEKSIAEALGRAKASGEIADALRAQYLIDLAWEARGSGYADSVTPEAAAKMDAYLEQAETLLTAAEKKYPKNVVIPTLMLTVGLGRGMTKPQMVEWFRKATAIDPSYTPAYVGLLCFLQPKWYGSPQEMLDFGVECLKTGDWENGVPMVFIRSINMLSEYESGFYGKHVDVSNLMGKTFRDYLRRYPESLETRTEYLAFACQTKDWPLVKEQLAILNNYWDMTQIDPWKYAEIVEAAAKH